VGVYGYPRDTTPYLDAFANEAVIFSEAISQSTFTKTSIASLFTSRYPHKHGVYTGSTEDSEGKILSDVLREDEVTLAEALSEAGYLTGGFLTQAHLREYMGFGQGFATYNADVGNVKSIHRKAIRWLQAVARASGFFLYLHYIDLHDPYQPPPPYDHLYGDTRNAYSGFDLENWDQELGDVRHGRRSVEMDQLNQMIARYDGLINHIDFEMGVFFAKLKDLGVYDDSLIIVTSDHGDGFTEHGFLSHSWEPYDELIRVPLLIKFPNGRYKGRVINEQVRLIDVMPTVLDIINEETGRENLQGFSLLNYLDEERRERSRGAFPRYSFSEYSYDKRRTYPKIGIRTKRLKYLFRPKKNKDQIFDLQEDPGEKVNIISARDAEALEFREMALEVVSEWRKRREEAEQVSVDEATVKELKALGYLN
jgi:arylsulfatase A-like enzyme